MVQHIRKKHPELAQLGSGMTAAVISSAPAVINADGATAEAVVVRNPPLMPLLKFIFLINAADYWPYELLKKV